MDVNKWLDFIKKPDCCFFFRDTPLPLPALSHLLKGEAALISFSLSLSLSLLTLGPYPSDEQRSKRKKNPEPPYQATKSFHNSPQIDCKDEAISRHHHGFISLHQRPQLSRISILPR